MNRSFGACIDWCEVDGRMKLAIDSSVVATASLSSSLSPVDESSHTGRHSKMADIVPHALSASLPYRIASARRATAWSSLINRWCIGRVAFDASKHGSASDSGNSRIALKSIRSTRSGSLFPARSDRLCSTYRYGRTSRLMSLTIDAWDELDRYARTIVSSLAFLHSSSDQSSCCCGASPES